MPSQSAWVLFRERLVTLGQGERKATPGQPHQLGQSGSARAEHQRRPGAAPLRCSARHPSPRPPHAHTAAAAPASRPGARQAARRPRPLPVRGLAAASGPGSARVTPAVRPLGASGGGRSAGSCSSSGASPSRSRHAAAAASAHPSAPGSWDVACTGGPGVVCRIL